MSQLRVRTSAELDCSVFKLTVPRSRASREAQIMKMQAALIGMVVGSAALSASGAKAGIVSYGSAVAFDAATTGDTMYSFAGLAPSDSFTDFPMGVTVGTTTFTSAGDLFAIGPAAGFGTYGVPYLSGQVNGASGMANLSLTNLSVTAFGFDYGSYYTDNPGDILDITVNGLNSYEVVLPTTASTTSFIGFTSTASINSITISNTSDPTRSAVDLTDFTTGSAAVSGVPEPSTWAMMLLGFGALGVLAYRKARGGQDAPTMAA